MDEEKKSFKEWIEKNLIIALVCALVIGLIIGCLGMYLVGGTRVARVKGKTLTSNDLYKKMKDYYSINLILEDIDAAILSNKYKLEGEELEELKKTAQKYIETYENYYGYTEEAFLSENGFDSIDDFVDYLSVDYKRTVYYYEYLEEKLEKDAVQKYYDENAFGKINTKHILAQISDEMTDEQALTLSKEIIGRLQQGEQFDELAEEYKTKYEGKVLVEDLGEQGAFDNLEKSYVDAMKELSKGEYTTTPVKTTYGYHVIYCVDKTDKTDKISRKDKMHIIEKIATNIMSSDSDLYTKVLIKMREDAKLKIYDKEIKEKYKEYCLPYVDEATGKVILDNEADAEIITDNENEVATE